MTTTQTRIEIDGASLYVETLGGGPALLFLNGGFGNNDRVRPFLEALARRFTVVAPEARGHGRSGLGNGVPLTYGRMALDAVRVLDALGLRRVGVFGHSDGGCLGLHLLLDHPERLTGVILSGTPQNHGSYTEMGRHLVAELPAAFARGEDLYGLATAHKAMTPEPDRWIEFTTLLGRTWQTQPAFDDAILSVVTTPTLVIRAGADPFIGPESFDRLAAAIPGARSYDWPEATHGAPTEAPERLASVVADFLLPLAEPAA